jgi:nucleotide-binding universal stress UspA family protein
MYAQIVVPLDGGAFSARALAPAARLAVASDARLRIVSFARTDSYLATLRESIEEITEKLELSDLSVRVDLATDTAEAIASEVDAEPGSLVCMSSAGRSHSAPILGSVAEGVLRRVSTPVLLVGPGEHADSLDLERPLVVSVDGSSTSESILPIVASWAIVYHVPVRVVCVVEQGGSGDESGYVRRIATQLEHEIERPVDFDVLHHGDVGRAVLDDLRASHAGAVAMATHGKTGLNRVVAGSTTMRVLHHAPCPVLSYRPIDFLR